MIPPRWIEELPADTKVRAYQLWDKVRNSANPWSLLQTLLVDEGYDTTRTKKGPVKLDPLECVHKVCDKCGKDLESVCHWKGKHPRYKDPKGNDAGPVWVQKSVPSGLCKDCKKTQGPIQPSLF